MFFTLCILWSCLLQSFREKNRAIKFFNNLSAVSEAIPALGWVSVVCSLPSICMLFLQYKHICCAYSAKVNISIKPSALFKSVDIMQTDLDVLAANKHQNVFVFAFDFQRKC